MGGCAELSASLSVAYTISREKSERINNYEKT